MLSQGATQTCVRPRAHGADAVAGRAVDDRAVTNERSAEAGRHRRWVVVACAALVLAAVGDAGPEIAESRSLVAGYDGPGPLIYLGFAAVAAAARWWRYAPLPAVAMSAAFIFGGLANADFTGRLTHPSGVATAGGWLQMLGFAAAIVAGTLAVRRPSARAR